MLISVVLSCDLSCDFFCSCWASLPINLVFSTRLAVYNSKSSKPNGSASPFKRKDLATFKSFHPASSMARSFTSCSPCQNLHDSKNELAGGTPIKGNNRCTPAFTATHALTPAVIPVVAPLLLLAPPTPLWLDTWRMISSRSLGPFWILDLLHLFRTPSLPPLCPMKAHVSGLWKLGSRTFMR